MLLYPVARRLRGRFADPWCVLSFCGTGTSLDEKMQKTRANSHAVSATVPFFKGRQVLLHTTSRTSENRSMHTDTQRRRVSHIQHIVSSVTNHQSGSAMSLSRGASQLMAEAKRTLFCTIPSHPSHMLFGISTLLRSLAPWTSSSFLNLSPTT